MEKYRQYQGIDVLKFIMAILVISLHIYPFTDINETLNYYTINWFSRLAVPFFFVCTGFFIFSGTIGEINRKLTGGGYFVRILKLYIIWTIIYSPLYIYDRILGKNNGIVKNAFFIARDFIFSGSYTQLWYLPATIVAVFPVWILKKMKVRWQAALALAVILYGIGLLGQTYYGLLEMIVGEHESVWMVLRFIMLIIATTRNGIFFGFLFILLGALVAEGKIMLSRRGAGIGFIVSMILFLGEAVLLRHMNWVKDGNMYIFMIPAVLCLFLLVSGWEPKKDMDYKRLRENSTLVFFIHLWVAAIIAGVWNRIMQIYHIGRMNSMCQFLLVTIFSVLLSFGIIKLSKKITILRNIY